MAVANVPDKVLNRMQLLTMKPCFLLGVMFYIMVTADGPHHSPTRYFNDKQNIAAQKLFAKMNVANDSGKAKAPQIWQTLDGKFLSLRKPPIKALEKPNKPRHRAFSVENYATNCGNFTAKKDGQKYIITQVPKNLHMLAKVV